MKTPSHGVEKQSRAQRCRANAGRISTRKSPTDAVLFFAIFGCAFLLRVIYLFQIESIPLFYQLAGDGRAYDEWGQRIAAGDRLGTGVFYQAPLYPYFLAFLQILLGHDLWWIRVVQAILGALSCGFLYLAGKSFFSRTAGIAAALTLSIYAPAIFYGSIIEKTVTDLFLLSLLLVCLASIQLKPHWAKWIASGVLVGLSGLSRENVLVLVFIVPIWIWLYFLSCHSRVRIQWVGLFLAGLLLVLLPVGLRNLYVGGEFTLTTSQLGPNFFIGNNAAADGTYASVRLVEGEHQFEGNDAKRLAEQALGRSLSAGEVSRYWLQRSLHYIRSEPMDWLRLMARKWLLLWNIKEIEDSDDYYIYQQWSSLLWLIGWGSHFGLLAPLAAIGLLLTAREWRKLWLLYAMLLALAVSVALFYLFGRYRFPLVPLLVLFAGAAVVELASVYRAKGPRGLLIAGVVSLPVVAIVYWPVVGTVGPSAVGYNNLGNALLKQGRIAEAKDSYEKALAIDPGYGLAHFNLGNVFVTIANPDRATRHLQEAIKILPRFAEARGNLGKLLADRGDIDGAAQQFNQALQINPDLAPAHLNLGIVLVRQGRLSEATRHFEHVLRIQPESAEAYYYLGGIAATQGQLDKAVGYFREAIRIEPQFAEAHRNLGEALAMQGKRDDAVQHYQTALRLLKAQQETSAR